MFFKRNKHKRPPLLKKRAWITVADTPLWGWIHDKRPKGHFASGDDGDYALLSKSAMRILGIFGVERDEVIEIEVSVVERGKF